MTKLYSYVVVSDHGFAPNPFHGYCTLANCKPRIRGSAQPGDWILGSASRAGGGAGHAVFAMRVSEVLSFEAYWQDERFRKKRPNRRSAVNRCGDNIYFRDAATGEWRQRLSMHSNEDGSPSDWHIHYDTGVDRVLIGEEFIYWGGAGPPLPRFAGVDIRTKGIGYRCHFPAEVQQEFEEWFGSLAERGVCGRPRDFPTEGRIHPSDC